MRWRRHIGWSPRVLPWRIAVLFMVGATLFAVGSFPPYFRWASATIVGATFFVGSVFFTSAAYSQYVQVINAGSDAPPTRTRLWSWAPRTRLWWATLVQFTGTLFFNVNTFRAWLGDVPADDVDRLVWAPDFLGSIAFLVASHLAWLDVCGRLWCVDRDDRDWWVAALNYLGSIFFMLAAIGAFVLPTSGDVVNITWVNLGTFAGAVCFFAGAYLLLDVDEG